MDNTNYTGTVMTSLENIISYNLHNLVTYIHAVSGLDQNCLMHSLLQYFFTLHDDFGTYISRPWTSVQASVTLIYSRNIFLSSQKVITVTVQLISSEVLWTLLSLLLSLLKVDTHSEVFWQVDLWLSITLISQRNRIINIIDICTTYIEFINVPAVFDHI